MKGHNFDHGTGTVCEKCGKTHVCARLGDFRKYHEMYTDETIKQIKEKWKISRVGRKPWNTGLTKESDNRLKQSAEMIGKSHKKDGYVNSGEFKKGMITWNKGLTKETDERVAIGAKKIIGHKVKNPNVFNEWKKKNGVVSTYPVLKYIDELGHSVRSSWERLFALELQTHKISYLYESKTFEVNIDGKVHRYTPDFFVSDVYIEIKSFILPQKIRIINMFIEQYPEIKYFIIGLDKQKNLKELNTKIIPWSEMKCVVNTMC